MSKICSHSCKLKTQAFKWILTECSTLDSMGKGSNKATSTQLMVGISNFISMAYPSSLTMVISNSSSGTETGILMIMEKRIRPNLMRMVSHCNHQRRLRISSTPSQALSMRKRNSQRARERAVTSRVKAKLTRNKTWTRALFAWKTCSQARWWKPWHARISSIQSA